MSPLDTGSSAAPPVSAIVATRDRPELLRRSLDAILTQDYPGSIECVVVYDQQDPDPTLARTSPGRTVRTIRNSRTPGLAGARNSGALVATGEWLAFCDDDDVWRSDKLRLQLAAAAMHAASDVVVSGVTIDFEGRQTVRVPAPRDVAFPALLRSRSTAAHPSSVVVRRAAFLGGIGMVDEEIPGSYGEDYDWLLRAARRGPVAVVEQPLVTVLWGRTSFFADRWATMVAAIRYLLGKHPEFLGEPLGLARLYGRMAFAYAAMGDRPAARRYAGKALKANWRERRAYVSLLVSTGLVGPGTALRLAHATGRGI
jgi:glycosyltransferase involved in cell wall biosynthesis